MCVDCEGFWWDRVLQDGLCAQCLEDPMCAIAFREVTRPVGRTTRGQPDQCKRPKPCEYHSKA